jgi:hypothetical protein
MVGWRMIGSCMHEEMAVDLVVVAGARRECVRCACSRLALPWAAQWDRLRR